MDIKRPAKEDTGKLSLLALLMYRSATSGGKFTAIRFSLRFIFAPVGAALEHMALMYPGWGPKVITPSADMA